MDDVKEKSPREAATETLAKYVGDLEKERTFPIGKASLLSVEMGKVVRAL